MAYGFGSEAGKGGGERRTLWAALRPAGRVALWALVGLLLIRGAAGLLGPGAEGTSTVRHPAGGGTGQAVSAFAVRFARGYLEDPSQRALAPFLATGARVGEGRPASGGAAGVAQAEVVRSSELGDGREIVTVACELRDSRTLYLAVPIVRQGAGGVAALGAPSIVAVPAVAGDDPERPRPPAGSGAAEIEELVRRFLPAYLSAGEESELRYYLAPGAGVVPLGGALKPAGVPTVDQLGAGEGRERSLLVAARVEDPAAGAAYPLAYRLEVVERGGRWYVASVEGAVA
ncbi:MAG: conjugal transfer protein [Actinobacteria bacterium]|nr:conjugal transfer protein [Actinomycetota bacterium]